MKFLIEDDEKGLDIQALFFLRPWLTFVKHVAVSVFSSVVRIVFGS